MATIRAVLFDFDGVLAKTMEDNFNAWKAAMRDYGIEIQPDDYYPVEGLKVHDVPAHLFGKYGLAVPEITEVVKKKETHYLQNHKFELYPGVVELLADLRKKKILTAVVTAALRNRLAGSVPSGFLESFDTVVTGDELKEGKPSPAPYLLAASKLNLKPSECVVVENAPLGVQSAKRAGIYCLGLSTTMAPKYLHEADEILPSFLHLEKSPVIQELLK